MHNCIYSGHCTNQTCDQSCPTLVETSYLLERNNIDIKSAVFKSNKEDINKCLDILTEAEGKFRTLINDTLTDPSDLLTYCAISQNWKGSRLHCTVYNLRFSKYIDDVKQSWSGRGNVDLLDYTKVVTESAKVLIISNLEYVNFKDMECQTLLTLIQNRVNKGLTTIVISPKISNLVGSGPFFGRLTEVLRKGVNTK